MLAGCGLGAALPVLLGVYGMTSDWVYSATLNPLPNSARCGLGALCWIGLIFVIGPFFGFFGAVCGWLMGLLDHS